MERFQVGSSTELIPITYPRQNCYKVGNKVHIEFVASTQQDMASNVAWAMIPKKYAPNTKYGSNTGYTGICVIETSTMYLPAICGAYASPIDENVHTGYGGAVYQSVSSSIPSGMRVQIMMEYYI